MKIDSSVKIFPSFIVLGIVGAAALLTPPLRANEILVFTENSSTSLTLTLNGTDITSTSVTYSGTPDLWSVILPANYFWQSGNLGWTEGTDLYNLLAGPFGSNTLVITSDFSVTGAPLFPFTNNGGTFISAASHDGVGNVDVQFIDNGDALTAVPDTGPTFILLFVALVGLFSASRFRSLGPNENKISHR